MHKLNNQALLSDDVAAEYEVTEDLTGGGSRQVFPEFGVVDLKKITLEEAGDLVNRGFKWLRKLAEPEPEPEPVKGKSGKAKEETIPAEEA